MFGLLSDKLETARLRARYQRRLHERLLELTETAASHPVCEDTGDWTLLGGSNREMAETVRVDARTQARELTRTNPYACNIIRLLEVYVAGPGLKLVHQLRDQHDPPAGSDDVRREADRIWADFLTHNQGHYSFQEHVRRAWRDGECFVRKFSQAQWPPDLRFVDPETIGPTREHPDSQGILTDALDVESPRWYLQIDPESDDLLDQVDAQEMLHTRIGVDSNQKRGVTIFTSILDSLTSFHRWFDTELTARKLQSSIVLWRKVAGGGASSAASFASDSALEDLRDPAALPPSRLQPGSVLTTGNSTDIQFVQPDTNYSDAVPLGRLLLLSTAAGCGLPEFMLTSDASNANYASTMIAEGPAVKMFQAQQHFFADEFTRLWRWVMANAISSGRMPAEFFDWITAEWCFPELVNRDRPRERHVDTRMVSASILSRAEVARREGLDPDVMRREIAAENPPERQSEKPAANSDCRCGVCSICLLRATDRGTADRS
jgi:capsid protein